MLKATPKASRDKAMAIRNKLYLSKKTQPFTAAYIYGKDLKN